MVKNKWGRPNKINENVLSKLEDAFKYWMTDIEACLEADISTNTLYRYCEEHPEFRERKEELKNNPKRIAKRNIVDSIIKWDKDDSKRYLETKWKDEFSKKLETKNEHTWDLNINLVSYGDNDTL